MTLIPVPSPQKGKGEIRAVDPPYTAGCRNREAALGVAGINFMWRELPVWMRRARSGYRTNKGASDRDYRFGTDEWIVVQVTCQRELKFALRGVGVPGQETARTEGRPHEQKETSTNKEEDRHEQRCERPGRTDSGTDEWIVVHVTCQRELKFALRGVGVLGQETGTNRRETGTNKEETGTSRGETGTNRGASNGTYRLGTDGLLCM